MGLPAPGSPTFTPLLLDYLQTHPRLQGWSIDPSLFSVILLTLLVKKGGLVVDVEQDGIGKVRGVVDGIIRHIFGLRTHHIDLESFASPSEIPLRLLTSPHSTPTPTPPKLPSRPSSSLRNPSSLRKSHVDSTRPSSDNDRYHHRQHDKEGNELRCPDVLLVSGLEDASSPARIKLCDILTKRRVEIPHDTDGDQVRKWVFEPTVIWVREEGTEVPSWVTDHFMCGLNISPDDVDLPPSDLSEKGVLPSPYIPSLTTLLPYTHMHPPLSIHISNLLSAVSSHPSLRSAMTQRAVRAFPDYVRAHRILQGDFELPESFILPSLSSSSTQTGNSSDKQQTILTNGKTTAYQRGVGGDIDTWADLAGEEPSVSALGLVHGGGGEDEQAKENLEGWYATPTNVEGVWGVCLTHRVRRREEREEVMWLMKGGAGDGQQREGRTGRDVGRILDDIIAMV